MKTKRGSKPSKVPLHRDNREPDSNVTVDSFSQLSKLLESTISTEAGKHIFLSPLSKKASFPILRRRDPGSNVTTDRLTQKQKQDDRRLSTLDGMHMDRNERQSSKALFEISNRRDSGQKNT
jgi:hypothetical protein